MALMLMFRSDWNFVAIDAGYGTGGFFFNETGLQYAGEDGFAGWLGKRFSRFSFCRTAGSKSRQGSTANDIG